MIGDVRLEDVAVSEEVQFPGGRADLRVSGHRIVELAAEVVAADRLQIIGDLVRQRRLDEGQCLACVIDDVGVGHRRPKVPGAVGVVEREGLDEAVGAHPAVAVPLGGTAFEAHAVDHSVAREPVGGGLARVGAVTQIPAVDLGRDGALDRQVVVGEFVGHRRVIPLLEEQAGGGQVGGVGCDVGHAPTLTVQI